MEILIVLGLLLALAGLAGCLLPVVPGPPLSFAAIILLNYTKGWEPFSTGALVVMAGLTLAISILDYIIPAGGARKYGASKKGVWGSLIGMAAGLLLLPPWGLLPGAVAGALAGELLAGKQGSSAARAAWGVFLGYVLSTGLKLVFCAALLVLYIREML